MQRTTLMTAMLAASALTLAGAAGAAPAFRLEPSDGVTFGARALDEGRFEIAAERSALMVEQAGTSRKLRAPALVNLCVAEAMQGDFAAASAACDAAVDNAWEVGTALNNRGVVKAAAGDYAGAVQDFEAALAQGGSRETALHNLGLARQRVAARDAQRTDSVAATASDADAQGS